MTVVCSECKKVMGSIGAPNALVSHGICRKCWGELYPQYPPDEAMEKEWKQLEGTNGTETVV